VQTRIHRGTVFDVGIGMWRESKKKKRKTKNEKRKMKNENEKRKLQKKNEKQKTKTEK
jgi:hypothetical protein